MTTSKQDSGYRVVLTGKLLAGAEKKRAATSLAKFLNTSTQRAVSLLKGKSKVIKKEISKEQALKYRALLISHGIGVEISHSGVTEKSTKSSSSAPAKKPVKSGGSPASSKVTHISEAARSKNNKPLTGRSALKSRAKNTRGAAPKPGLSSAQKEGRVKNTDNNIFSGVLQCKRVSMLQQFALLASCSALVVLAVFYLGLFFTSLFFSLERIFSFFFFNEASSIFTAIFLYLIPGLVALLFCVLMLRPVFAKRMKTERLEIDAKNEKNLTNFVKQVALIVGAPKPEEILLTDEFEANAEFQPGWNAIKEGNIQLRIGLPLLMVLDIPALAGLIAATLARFDDKTGMYMLMVIREANARLENAWHNRDNWQDVLDGFARSKYAFFSAVLSRLYQPILTLSSWMALPFMFLVRILSAAVSRTYVYRADNYFSAVSGTRKFVEHFTLLYQCRFAFAEAEESLRAGIESKKFVNDLPALIIHAHKNLEQKVYAEVDDAVVENSTAWDDLKACNRDRMIKAEEEDYDGMVELKAEAWRLLQDLKATSREFTLAYYQLRDYGIDEKQLVDARELATTSNEERKRDEVCRQYFNEWFSPDLFWQANQFTYACSISKQQRIVEINESIKKIRRSSPDFMSLKNEVPEQFKKYSFSRFATEIHKAGYRPGKDIPFLEDVSIGDLANFNDLQRREYETRRAQQRDLCRVMGERLCFALAFLKDERERKIADVVLSILTTLESQANQLESLHYSVSMVSFYKERIKKKNEKEHSKRLRRISREILNTYQTCIGELRRYRWPFGSQYKTLADFINSSIPVMKSLEDTENSSMEEVLDSRIELYEALWASLTRANHVLNGKIAPLALQAELENNIARIKMTVSGKQAG